MSNKMYTFTKEEQYYLDSVLKGNDWWKENTPSDIVHSAASKYCRNIYKKWEALGDVSNLEWIVQAYGK